MKSTAVDMLINNISGAVYPSADKLRERHILAQSLYLLVYLARRQRKDEIYNAVSLTKNLLIRLSKPTGTSK